MHRTLQLCGSFAALLCGYIIKISNIQSTMSVSSVPLASVVLFASDSVHNLLHPTTPLLQTCDYRALSLHGVSVMHFAGFCFGEADCISGQAR